MPDLQTVRFITATDVEDWLNEALRSRDGGRLRKQMPPQEERERFARFLNALREADYPSPPIDDPEENLRRYGKLFMHHAPEARRWFESARDRAKVFDEGAAEHFQSISTAIEAVVEIIAGLLNKIESPPNEPWHKTARNISCVTKTLWRSIGKPPKDVAEDSILATFTAAAMNAIRPDVANPLTPVAVSEALRGRRGVKKEGKRSNCDCPCFSE